MGLKAWFERERKVATVARNAYTRAREHEVQPVHPKLPQFVRDPYVDQDPQGQEFASLAAAWLVRRIFHPQGFLRYLFFPLWLLLMVLYVIEYVYRLEPFYRLLKVLLFAGALAAAVKYLLTG